ncbi:exopolysaccharide biosynthesis protein [Oscillatoria sp. CS-180]|uniref:exopolysaccharide biosynthesis protein n=1 Tax=Oscillatoria sp. CS-180 TaxID=3021720 RepID=UPI00232E5EB4|nr:exopolysaccharide biosynthesis protein [Oscillatoria sp. CS-180]MDB9529889.1 exopolysaccharide biosynthesis protein [Oscillatoria sp. CS-180]
MARLSAELERFFFSSDRAHKVTLADILNLSEERTFGFLFVILALPSALPIPAPGYSTPFGVVMFLLAVQLMTGRQKPWFPKSWKEKGFALEQIQKLMKKGIPWLKRIEVFSRPRLTPICTSYPGRVVIGIAIAMMSVCMMIPIPGTNTFPALCIFVIGFGFLDDDGFISLVGLTLCALAASVVGVIVFAGVEGGSAAIRFILNSFPAR